MKTLIEVGAFATLLALLVGCSVVSPLRAVRHALAPDSAQLQVCDDDSAAKAAWDAAEAAQNAAHKPTLAAKKHVLRIPATVAQSSSPVAHSVARIVHLMELAGVLCLIAGGVLLYLGIIIPGVKCVLAGVCLPVSAVWFNYHYGMVIAGLLISAAVGFLWALNKKHPEYLAAAESRFVDEGKRLRSDFAAEIEKVRAEFIPRNPPGSSPVIPKSPAVM